MKQQYTTMGETIIRKAEQKSLQSLNNGHLRKNIVDEIEKVIAKKTFASFLLGVLLTIAFYKLLM